jgi:hypothetical protein
VHAQLVLLRREHTAQPCLGCQTVMHRRTFCNSFVSEQHLARTLPQIEYRAPGEMLVPSLPHSVRTPRWRFNNIINEKSVSLFHFDLAYPAAVLSCLSTAMSSDLTSPIVASPESASARAEAETSNPADLLTG